MTDEETRREKRRARNQRWAAANPDKAREAARRWRQANPDKVRGYNQRWRGHYREQRREYALRSKYGLSGEEHAALSAAQNGRCYLCPPDAPEPPRLVVDHCHTTGAVRGLICTVCNLALHPADTHGHTWFDRARDYLRHPPAQAVLKRLRQRPAAA